MHSFQLPPLPDIYTRKFDENSLQELHPAFFIKRLQDTPQDPILEALQSTERVFVVKPAPDLETVIQEGGIPNVADAEGDDLRDIWRVATGRNKLPPLKDEAISWDHLRVGYPSLLRPRSSPFLTEQSIAVSAALHCYVQPKKNAGGVRVLYINSDDFLQSMMTNLLGNSSALYVWDGRTDKFSLNNNRLGKTTKVVVEGLDEATTASIARRFHTIGSLLRRLENLALHLRTESTDAAVSSFTHGLTEILSYLHGSWLLRPQNTSHLIALHAHYDSPEKLVTAIAKLCLREPSRLPPYPTLPNDLVSLSNHVYRALQQHQRSHSPHYVQASMAYLLTLTSRESFRRMGESLGLVYSQPGAKSNSGIETIPTEDGDVDDDVPDCPEFIQTSVSRQISRARRSLHLLSTARPTHPLCHTRKNWEALCQGWVWTDPDVTSMIDMLEGHIRKVNRQIDTWRWEGLPPSAEVSFQDEVYVAEDIETPPLHLSEAHTDVVHPPDKPDLTGLRIFDLEPGSLPTHRHALNFGIEKRGQEPPDFATFLHNLPTALPSATPTLDILIETTLLQPLVAHAQLLSTSLLDLFLSDLDLVAHLDLLRRFMLFGDPGFAARLRSALFTEELVDADLRTKTRSRSRSRSKHRRKDVKEKVWGVGINPTLSERETWPPGGSELAFSLRRVVVDTLDEGRMENEDGERKTGGGPAQDLIWEEAEWRLGFVIRNLGDDSENEDDNDSPNWLDPMSIEALDFLDMVYKPPSTIAVLVTPDIMEKYHRVFTFLLRILRVESVARMIFRSTRHDTSPALLAFSVRSPIRKQLNTLRFQVTAFMSTLNTYIFDSAIGLNFSAFLDRLAKLRHGVPDGPQTSMDDADDIPTIEDEELRDVFSILAYHSAVMDKILEACLLKARHRSTAASLTECLESIILLGKIVVEINDGKMTEEEAERMLERLHISFEASMTSLVHALRLLDEGGLSRRSRVASIVEGVPASEMTDADLKVLMSGEATFGSRGDASGLSDLLVRLDADGWYGGMTTPSSLNKYHF